RCARARRDNSTRPSPASSASTATTSWPRRTWTRACSRSWRSARRGGRTAEPSAWIDRPQVRRRGRRCARAQADAAADFLLAHGQLLVRARHVPLGVRIEGVYGGETVLRAGFAQREVGKEGEEHRGQPLRELVVVAAVIGEDALGAGG